MRWEYWVRVLALQSGAETALRKLLTEAGQDGWELVSVTQFEEVYTLFFKRPV